MQFMIIRKADPDTEADTMPTEVQIASFTLIYADSFEHALEWVRKWPEKNVDLELRQVFESEEFGEAYTPELQEQEAAMRECAAENR